jgi:hypothetical protein
MEQKDLERGQTNRLRVRWPCSLEVLCTEQEYKELTCITSGWRRDKYRQWLILRDHMAAIQVCM